MTTTADSDEPPSDSIQRAQSAIQSLSTIITPLPSSLSSSPNPTLSLLSDPSLSSTISHHLRLPSSGAGDDNLCRWLYDTFQSTDSSLQLVVLRFLPTIAGLYLSRSTAHHRPHQPLAGFEAVLLALYAHQTLTRDNKPLTVDLPNLSFPSPYHEATKIITTRPTTTNTESCIAETAVISEALIPHGTVRSTKRARIVGVALELYYSRISEMPVESKSEFCRFVVDWAGFRNGEAQEVEGEVEEKGKRIAMPWELLRPVMRIVGHCLLGQAGSEERGEEEVKMTAEVAAEALYERAMHDMDTGMVLATRSLVRVGKMATDAVYSLPEMDSVYSSAAAAAAAAGAAAGSAS